MNKVWVVKGGIAYEGFDIISMWGTETEANADADRVKRDPKQHYDDVEVECFVVGEVAK